MKTKLSVVLISSCLLLMSCEGGGEPTTENDRTSSENFPVNGDDAIQRNSGTDTDSINVESQAFGAEDADPDSVGVSEITEHGLSVVRMPNGDRFFEGDILVPDIAPQPTCPSSGANNGDRTTTSLCYIVIDGISGDFWPGRMPVKFDNLDAALEKKVNDARFLLAIHSSLTLPMWSNSTLDRNHVRIKQGKSNYSTGIGMTGGEQVVSLRPNAPFGTVVHELLHAAGFYHEQSRPDRDSPVAYIKYFDGNVVSGKGGNFKVHRNTIVGGEYDYNSVMHYGPYGWSSCADGSNPKGSCSKDTQSLVCPGGNSPGPANMGYRCPTIEALRTIPFVDLTCLAGEYDCLADGTLSDNRMGQRDGLSPSDLAGLQAIYHGPEPVTTLGLNISYLIDSSYNDNPAILLDGDTIIETVRSSWYDFEWGPLGVTPGAHQLSVVKTRDDDRNSYEVLYGGDCDREGNVVVEFEQHRHCDIEIRLIPEHTVSTSLPEGVTSNPFEFTWDSPSSSRDRVYEIRIATNGLYSNWEEFYSAHICDEFGTRLCSIPSTEFRLTTGSHQWQVRVMVGSQWGPWSRSKRFEIR